MHEMEVPTPLLCFRRSTEPRSHRVSACSRLQKMGTMNAALLQSPGTSSHKSLIRSAHQAQINWSPALTFGSCLSTPAKYAVIMITEFYTHVLAKARCLCNNANSKEIEGANSASAVCHSASRAGPDSYMAHNKSARPSRCTPNANCSPRRRCSASAPLGTRIRYWCDAEGCRNSCPR